MDVILTRERRPAPSASVKRPATELRAEGRAYGTDFLKTTLLPRLGIDEGRFKPGIYASSSDVLYRQTFLQARH